MDIDRIVTDYLGEEKAGRFFEARERAKTIIADDDRNIADKVDDFQISRGLLTQGLSQGAPLAVLSEQYVGIKGFIDENSFDQTRGTLALFQPKERLTILDKSSEAHTTALRHIQLTFNEYDRYVRPIRNALYEGIDFLYDCGKQLFEILDPGLAKQLQDIEDGMNEHLREGVRLRDEAFEYDDVDTIDSYPDALEFVHTKMLDNMKGLDQLKTDDDNEDLRKAVVDNARSYFKKNYLDKAMSLFYEISEHSRIAYYNFIRSRNVPGGWDKFEKLSNFLVGEKEWETARTYARMTEFYETMKSIYQEYQSWCQNEGRPGERFATVKEGMDALELMLDEAINARDNLVRGNRLYILEIALTSKTDMAPEADSYVKLVHTARGEAKAIVTEMQRYMINN